MDKKEKSLRLQALPNVAGRTGLEPAASGVTGRRYNQLNYRPVSGKDALYSTGNPPVHKTKVRSCGALGVAEIMLEVRGGRDGDRAGPTP